MRTIKFRALLSETNLWVYGDLARGISVDPDGPIYDCIIIDSDKNDFWVVRRETVGEFTGLLDKNGKEIYEGDIVKWVLRERFGDLKTKRVSEIKWNDGLCGFSPIVYDNECEDGFYSYRVTKLEVIGNIHENPELL